MEVILNVAFMHKYQSMQANTTAIARYKQRSFWETAYTENRLLIGQRLLLHTTPSGSQILHTVEAKNTGFDQSETSC